MAKQSQGGQHQQSGRGSGGGHHRGSEPISAPYNFVPLSSWVHIPKWGPQVSHDLPFENGCSGEIAYTLVAQSPLLVGGEQDKTGTPGEVRPFKTPGKDGCYAVPGSSLKGMIRAVVEVAGFGRMRMVDDARPSLRDIIGKHVANSYTAKVRDKIKTGFMRQRHDGGPEIVPCAMTRLDHRKLESALGVPSPIFRARTGVADKYQTWRKHCQNKKWDPSELKFSVQDNEAGSLGEGDLVGIPVFTGQISDSTKPKGKRRDFVFYDSRPEDTVAVDDAEWRDFLLIHGEEDGNRSMAWPGHWRHTYRAGGEVPVFYLQDGSKLRIGLAFMPKLAGDFSIHDMIGHSADAHLQTSGQKAGYDLADLLFGAAGEEDQSDALRGRISFEPALTEGTPEIEQQDDTILNGPKPTYFPNYVTQKANPQSWKLNTSQYATYIETQDHPRPTIRGFKRYPARPPAMVGVQALTSEQRNKKKVQVRLHTLFAGTHFTGRIVFHNLRHEELGALLWALTWGNEPKLCHGLGMAKSFGFGQVRFEIDLAASQVYPNDPGASRSKLDEAVIRDFLDVFTGHMEAGYQNQGEGAKGWAGSPQIANLLAMADPAAAEDFPGELRHMCLEAKARSNEFQDAKKAGLVLADYAVATGRLDKADLPQPKGPGAGRMGVGKSSRETGRAKHPWLVKNISEIAEDHKISRVDDVWGGQPLAKKWAGIDEPETRAAVLEEIRAYWQERGWWDKPPKGAKRKAKVIYDDSVVD